MSVISVSMIPPPEMVAVNTLVWTIPGFLIAAGIGSVIRYIVSSYLNDHVPTGTLIVNAVASFLLGIAASLGDSISVILGIGLLGAMSTWSAVANEAATLARKNEGWLALTYLALTCSSGVLLAWFGLKLGTVL